MSAAATALVDGGHCQSMQCQNPRLRAGGICGCKCAACVQARGERLAAAIMDHCGSTVCLQRLKPGGKVPYPACPCGCATCDAIAVKAGIRPASNPYDFRSEEGKAWFAEQEAKRTPAPSAAQDVDDDFPEVLADPDFPDLLEDEPENDGGPESTPPPAPSPLASPEAEDEGIDLDFPELEEASPSPAPELDEHGDSLLEEEDSISIERWPRPDEKLHDDARADRVRLPLHDPPSTGSKMELVRSCLYWTQAGAEHQADESGEDALFGVAGHTFAEEWANGTVTAARQEEILETCPPKKRDELATCLVHVRKWLDTHRGSFRRSEVPVAWDPQGGGDLGRGVELAPTMGLLARESQAALLASGETMDRPRSYSQPGVWAALRAKLELGPLSIPATVDLVNFVDGEVTVYDWCFGRTDKKRQLALGALAMASVFKVERVRGVALYVDDDGVREVVWDFDTKPLLDQAAEFRALLELAPDATPLPGMHCVDSHCPARVMCPVTQTASAMVYDPAAAPDVVLEETPIGIVKREYRFRPLAVDDTPEQAAWYLPRLLLVIEAGERGWKSLTPWVEQHGAIPTSPAKEFAFVHVKGRVSFNQKLAVALLQTLGATEEQLAGLYTVGPQTKHLKDRNRAKGGKAA